jgi:hypothetical protein
MGWKEPYDEPRYFKSSRARWCENAHTSHYLEAPLSAGKINPLLRRGQKRLQDPECKASSYLWTWEKKEKTHDRKETAPRVQKGDAREPECRKICHVSKRLFEFPGPAILTIPRVIPRPEMHRVHQVDITSPCCRSSPEKRLRKETTILASYRQSTSPLRSNISSITLLHSRWNPPR